MALRAENRGKSLELLTFRNVKEGAPCREESLTSEKGLYLADVAVSPRRVQ